MLAYIWEIAERRNKGIINRGSLRDFKSGQKDYKSGQGVQIGEKRFQIRAEITNRGKRDFESVQNIAQCSGSISLKLTCSYDGNQLEKIY